MLEPGKVGWKGTTLLMVGAVAPTAILIDPLIMLKLAKQDAWLCASIAICAGFVIGGLTVSLMSRFPGQTIVQCAEIILGKPLGKAVGLLYVCWLFHSSALIVCELSAFLCTAVLPNTPPQVLMIAGVLTTAYAVYHGLEVLSRFSQLSLPLMFMLFLVVVALLSKDMKLTRMLPLFDREILPILKGSIPPSSRMGEVALLGMMTPYLMTPEQAGKVAFWSVITNGFFLMVSLLAPLLTFGPDVAGMWTFPVYSAVRVVLVAGFLERLQAGVVSLWVLGGVAKLGVFYYCALLGSAQLLGLRDFRPLVLPAAALLIALSSTSFHNVSEVVRFVTSVWPFYGLPLFELWVPLLLLLAAMIRGKGGAPRRE